MSKKILDIGCGNFKKPSAIGIDSIKLAGVDVVHDLNGVPYPFKDNTFNEVHCYHILEHLDDLMLVMKEIYRISNNGAKIFIRVPHASCIRSTWSDPTHKRGFTSRTFIDYFNAKAPFHYYSDTNFMVNKLKLNYCLYDGERDTKIPRWFQKLWNYLANFNYITLELWERILSNYIGGFEELYVELIVKKG